MIIDLGWTRANWIEATGGSSDAKQERVWASLVALGAFESQLSFILSDTQQSIRARSERAFIHLQRLIVADPDVRQKWSSAFNNVGELACERLGAVHLLLHGIWAFKVDAAGERTDLVFQDVTNLDDSDRAAALVLTEWKKATDQGEADGRFEDARRQAGRYSQGAMAGNELTAYRYLVVVTKRHIEVPPDRTEGDVVYRHVNVAVDPRSPSRR